MKRAPFVIAILGCYAAVGMGQGTTSESAKPFVVPGLISIESPHASLTWRKSELAVANEVTTAHYFICSNNDQSTPLILVVDERAAPEDFQRQRLASENYKVARKFAEKHGFRVESGKAPDVSKAKKNRVMYSVIAQHATQDIEMYIGGVTIFSPHRTYTLQAMAPDADSTKLLLSAVKTLKELPPNEKVSLNR